jgi:hypothetical protein
LARAVAAAGVQSSPIVFFKSSPAICRARLVCCCTAAGLRAAGPVSGCPKLVPVKKTAMIQDAVPSRIDSFMMFPFVFLDRGIQINGLAIFHFVE